MGSGFIPGANSGRLLTVALPEGKSADLVTPRKDGVLYAWRLDVGAKAEAVIQTSLQSPAVWESGCCALGVPGDATQTQRVP